MKGQALSGTSAEVKGSRQSFTFLKRMAGIEAT